MSGTAASWIVGVQVLGRNPSTSVTTTCAMFWSALSSSARVDRYFRDLANTSAIGLAVSWVTLNSLSRSAQETKLAEGKKMSTTPTQTPEMTGLTLHRGDG